MIRSLNIFLMITSVVALVSVYGLKYVSEGVAIEKRGLERAIEEQTGVLSMLRADWAYLNQPAQITPIVTRHAEALGLQPLGPRQYGSFGDLPMRPAAPDTAALDALFEALEVGIDPGIGETFEDLQ